MIRKNQETNPEYVRKRMRLSAVLNGLIVIFTAIGLIVMFSIQAPKGSLTAYGFANFKYYTVLSNVICGIVAAVYLRAGKNARVLSKGLVTAKLMAAAAVTLTFLTIAAFLGPIYGHALLYRGSNLFFHLIVPVLAMAEFVLLDPGSEIPLRAAVLSVVPTVLYGTCYAVNLFVNGIGQWPDTNDWYGFVNWGYPVGFGIFGMITLATFAAACLLRAVQKAFCPAQEKHK